MRWVRVGVIAAVLAAMVGVGTTSEPAGAAPMTGVTFIDPIRMVDLLDVPAGDVPVPLPPSPPPSPIQALAQVVVIPLNDHMTGVVMLHQCSVAADPLADVVLPITGHDPLSNFMYVPAAGALCATTTAPVTRLIVQFHGWVSGAAGGAAYVDAPFTHVATVTGGSTVTPISLATLGVPADSTGVAVWLDVTPSTAGYATLYPCGAPQPFASQANWVAGVPVTAVIPGVPVTPAGLCIYVYGDASVDISIDGYYEVGASPTSTSPPELRYLQESPPRFTGVSPQRLFDTRTQGAPVIGGQDYRLDLTNWVPADTTAVVMNVTATEPQADGFIAVHPCDGPVPDTSSLNFVAGQTVPNLVTVDAGLDLAVCFYASKTTHIVADLSGYYRFTGGDGFTPSAPVRMFDTRNTQKVAANSVLQFDMTPFVAADASSVVFNLTATEVAQAGYVTAFPCGQTPPNASNLNVLPGKTAPNLVTVALPADKHVCFFTTSGTQLLADLAGWYSPSATSGFIPLLPIRWVDTRQDIGDLVPAGTVLGIDFSIDFPDATAMVFNATVTEPQQAGYLTAFPCGTGDPPNASNVNFVPGQTVPNMTISAVDTLGQVCIFNSADLHWIVDVSGYFTDTPLFVPFFPDGTDIN